ncbi:hypothetical protein GQ44DRAFT_737578 [Phaeosphaeriaceae sp. PMI808]|nr:hypothetical protein GQ44DRAFT_737578 [Phaeosphaeriaceae sp. PMI808]
MSTSIGRPAVSITAPSAEASGPTTLQQQFSKIQFDTAAPTPTADAFDNAPSATASSNLPSATCASNSDCASDRTCSNGRCLSLIEAAPFGPAGNSGLEPTTQMSAPAAIGVGLGAAGFILLLIGLGLWYWRRRGRQPLDESGEAPPTNRTRSASAASDQKTLVASLPNSPQNARFLGQQNQMADASLAKIVESTFPDANNTEKEKLAFDRNGSSDQATRQRSLSDAKALPSPPTDMPLPPPPTEEKEEKEEKRYAINVNINKSMIFDDLAFNTVSSAQESQASPERMPKYRFEEYLPPIVRTPPLSISQKKASQQMSEYEMEPYPRKGSSSEADVATDDEHEQSDDTEIRRKRTLKKLESKPPQIPPPDLQPPSPSLSFNSYDWYQDIIGTDPAGTEDRTSRAPTPSLPERNPARTPTQTTFGASLSSHPPDRDADLFPQPLSPSTLVPSPVSASYLHPSTAALPSPPILVSPTAANFRLSPTVYTMPSRRPKAPPSRASLQSTMAQKAHTSRSWLPDDGLYLPEEGTHDSYTVFKERLDDASRPTSYSPL